MAGFHLHRSNRVERLVAELGRALETARGGAFDQEAVVVAGRGMGVWLSMQLSERLGVWATPVVYPRALIEDIARRVLGQNALGVEPLSEELLEWAIRAELPGLLAEPEFAELKRYLDGDRHGVRLSELAERLATVFDQYLTYRPEWARAWEGGGVVNVGPEDRFQPLLFRRVAARLGCRHLGQIEPDLLARLGEPRALSLPPRVSVLGVSTLPPLYVRVLVALARHTDVHLYLFAPSPHEGPLTRVKARQPLLAGLETVGMELGEVLFATLEEQGVVAVEHDCFEPPRADSLLGSLQAALYDPNAASPATAPVDAAGSVSVHACHGPSREVEVLSDQLLALMTRAKDPVAPEDVLVLVSDLETYAPLIEATFRREPGDPRFIPFHVSDRGGRSESALTDAFLRVLGLVRGRVTGAEVLDLLLLEPVRRRWGIDAAGADTIKGWVAEAGVRWGMDAAHREAAGVLPAGGVNTWRFGIQRLLLGYALPSDGRRDFRGLVGYDEVEGNDSELLGQLAGFVRTLFGWLRDLETPRSISDWSVAAQALLGVLFEETPDTLRQTAGIRRALVELVRTATVAGFEARLDVAVVRQLIERRVDGMAPERGFLAGGVTFSAMVPMRSIPFRVISVLGLNDTAFPRAPRPVEFDLVRNGQNPPALGDRSPREDDRYLFLETLCAAREKLVVTYSGKSVRDDRELAPSVCLAELLEALCGASGDQAKARRAKLVVKHHLQSFSPRYFDGKDPRLFSYSEEHVGGARGLVTLESGERTFIRDLPRVEPPAEIALEDLVRFFKSPPAYLLNRRLGIYLRAERAEIKAREPLDLDALERWKLGDPLLEHCLLGVSAEDSERLLRGKGEVPLGAWGGEVLAKLRAEAQRIAELVLERRGGPEREPVEVSLRLPSGIRLTGSLGCLYPGGRVEHAYAKSAPKRLLALFIRHLALAATGRAERSALVTRAEKERTERRKKVKVPSALAEVFRPLGVDDAVALLDGLVGSFVEGQSRALPFLPAASYAYLHGIRRGPKTKGPRSPEEAVSAAISEYDDEIEREPHAPLAFDQRPPPFDVAYDADERSVEETEFHALAARVYDPLLEHLEEGTP